MTGDLFDQLERALLAEGAEAGIELLIGQFRTEGKYALVFEARLMQSRLALGLPLLHSGSISDVPAEQREAYEVAVTDAAREAGGLYLADGDIARAWPYFRVAGDAKPVAEA